LAPTAVTVTADHATRIEQRAAM